MMVRIGAFISLLCLIVGLQCVSSQVNILRWCTISAAEEQKCADMKTAFSSNSLKTLECIAGSSAQDCMEKIKSNLADLVTLDGGDVYVAGKEYNMIPIMQEVYASDPTGYYAIAVARKTSPEVNITSLEGKKSCHTGVRKTAGWNVPVGFLLENGYITPTDCQDDIRAAGNFFSQSCAPGALSSTYNPQGNNPTSLCDLCLESGCPRNSHEPYYNYAGAFRCLAERAGDVAFIKPVTITSNTDGNNVNNAWARPLVSSDYELLCRDGTRAAVGNHETCNLAFVPSHAVMSSKAFDDAVLQDFRSVLNQAQDLFKVDGNSNGFSMFNSTLYDGSDLLFKDSTQSLQNVENKQYTDYLGQDYIDTVKGLAKCPPGTLRWCTTSDQEKQKCQAMRDAFTSAGLTPSLSCYQTDSANACAEDIKDDEADLVSLDGGELFSNGQAHGVVPIMAEDYGEGDASYFAVAVVKRSSTFTINDLKGKKSCHTGYMRTAGWLVPIGFLINKGEIKVDEKCHIARAVGDYFSESCVPGVLEPENDPYDINPHNLCNLCSGEGSNNCKPNAAEPYVGYSGAFRCLAEDAGDVAFVKQTTVGSNTDGNGKDPWTNGLQKADYQLLCPDGSRANIDDWQNCNLAKVPSHTVVTAGSKSSTDRTAMVNLLTAGQNEFKDDSGSGFKMFDSSDYPNAKDLLFKDSTMQLIPTGDKDSYDTFLSEEYLADAEALACEPVEPKNPNHGTSLLPSLLVTLIALAIHRLARG